MEEGGERDPQKGGEWGRGSEGKKKRGVMQKRGNGLCGRPATFNGAGGNIKDMT